MARVRLDDDDDELIVSPDTGSMPKLLPVEQLQPNPENPRATDLEIDETAEDMKERGQLHNINVMSLEAFVAQKPHLSDKLTNQPYVVINGCRRLASARKAGLPGLKYEIHDEWSENQIDEAMITENVHRLDLNPLYLGRHLARMVPRYGSERALAKSLKRQPAWVNHRIGLTKLHPALQKAIEAGKIQFNVARECTRLHGDLQPLLASGELPQEVAQQWLAKERIKPAEQLSRWHAGPPYDAHTATPDGSGEYQVFTPREPGPGSGNGDQRHAEADEQGKSAAQQRSKRRQEIVIRVKERSPAALADALRVNLTSEEIRELIQALTV